MAAPLLLLALLAFLMRYRYGRVGCLDVARHERPGRGDASRRRHRRVTPLLALLAFLPAAAAAQALSPAESATVDGIVADQLAATGVPSASVAIVRHGRLAFAKAYGRQAPSIPTPRADAKYPIGSVSKQFTAAVILTLRDEGKLGLDETIDHYLPDITGGDRITIRMLLSHTSGLQDFAPQDYLIPEWRQATTPQAIVARWAGKPLDYPPGTQWQYSNTGYVVAGLIAEKVSGRPLLALVQERLLKPLGIDGIDMDLAAGPGFPLPSHRAALGPVRAGEPAATGWSYASGGLAMSAGDLARWDIARLDRARLPAADWTEQETPVRLADGRSTGYGLGVFVGTSHAQRRLSHGGEEIGFLTANDVYPETRDAVVVLVNADFASAESDIADAIATRVLFPRPPGLAGTDEAAALAQARATFDRLRQGRIEPARFTADARFYFTPETLGDYRASLGALGAVKSFTASGPPRLRGGFINRNFTAQLGSRTLAIVTYAETDGAHRYEQFLAMPDNP